MRDKAAMYTMLPSSTQKIYTLCLRNLRQLLYASRYYDFHVPDSGLGKVKKCFSFPVCANATGSEKFSLTIIGNT